MDFELQPVLENELVSLRPLRAEDFEDLYRVASDPLVWEQHPNRDRWKREVFEVFFRGAMESGGAFAVLDRRTGEMIGSSRYYDLDPAASSVAIGFTFLARRCWGGETNRAMKKLMLDHAFRFVETVIFHVGENNLRSRKAVEKLGAELASKMERQSPGDRPNVSVVYRLSAQAWRSR